MHSLLTRPGTGAADPAALAEDASGHAMRLFADLYGLTAVSAPVLAAPVT